MPRFFEKFHEHLLLSFAEVMQLFLVHLHDGMIKRAKQVQADPGDFRTYDSPIRRQAAS